MGRPFGEHLRLSRPDHIEVGSDVDWWTVERVDDSMIVLGTRRWFCGEAWLGYRLEVGAPPDGRSDSPAELGHGARVRQSAALRPRGVVGVLYWWLLWPIHLVVFEVMAKRQAVVKRHAAETRATEPEVAAPEVASPA